MVVNLLTLQAYYTWSNIYVNFRTPNGTMGLRVSLDNDRDDVIARFFSEIADFKFRSEARNWEATWAVIDYRPVPYFLTDSRLETAKDFPHRVVAEIKNHDGSGRYLVVNDVGFNSIPRNVPKMTLPEILAQYSSDDRAIDFIRSMIEI